MSKRKLSLKDFEKEVVKLDSKMTNPEDSNFKTAVILLASLQEGPNINRITKFTKYDRKFVQERMNRARQGGIFVGGKVSCEWFEEDGGIAFWCDVLVAQGLLERKSVGA